MKPLIDADVLRMEIGSVGQTVDEDGEIVMRSWDFVQELLDAKIHEICELVWADEPPTLFLTSDSRTHKILHRKTDAEFIPNFRYEVADVKPYKGTRKSDKPLHYDNLTAYMLNCYDCVVAEGLEADDLLAIHQTNYRTGRWTGDDGRPVESVICSRDKDLRMVEGYHYSWTCGKQEAFGPECVDAKGYLQPTYDDGGEKPKLTKVFGVGSSFFCYQLLVGDTVDNIPGIPRVGPVKALKILEGCDSTEDMLKAVRDAYREHYEGSWPERMLEQGQLLWMCTEMKGGEPVMWKLPEYLFGVE